MSAPRSAALAVLPPGVSGRALASLTLGALVPVLLSISSCGSTSNRSVERGGARSAPITRGEGAASAPAAGLEGEALVEPAPAEPGSGAMASSHADLIIGRAAGQDVRASELLARWLHRESPRVRTYLEELVLEKVITVEAQRLGIKIPDADIERERQRVFDAIQAEIDESAPGLSLDEFIQRRRGLDPERYRAQVSSDRALEMLAERCMRSWLLSRERCEVRVIVVTDRKKLEQVEEALAAGSDFGELARSHSEHSSSEAGGRMPAVVRSHTAISRLAFSTPVGQVGGPVDESGQYLLLQVIDRPALVEGAWSVVRAPVEASLARHPIEDPEYWQWKDAMLETYEVDTTRFLQLVGEE